MKGRALVNKLLNNWWTVGIMILIYFTCLYLTAWLSDDAFITYRTVDNFVNGFGLSFDANYRVQAFTHPLWMLIHVIPFLALDNAPLSGLGIALLISALAVGIICWVYRKEPTKIVIAITFLVSSAAFIQYSTSGLENPLSHLLLLGLFLVYQNQRTDSSIKWISILGGLVVLTRMDLFLIVLPVLCAVLIEKPSLKTIRSLGLGFLPFVIWEIFSVVYYGFPFPNSAYAKLNVSLTRWDLIEQGVHYFQNSILNDPTTLFVIVVGVALAMFGRKAGWRSWGVGILLYLCYVLWIGGDFMSGRFFTSVFLISVLILVEISNKKIALCALVLGMFSSFPPLLAWEMKPEKAENIELSFIDENGVADEWAYYYAATGLRNYDGSVWPNLERARIGKKLSTMGRKVYKSEAVGFLGYYAGPETSVLDLHAITDPFLSQMPNVYMPDWRPGHNQRLIPPGYIESVSSNTNKIKDERLARLYDEIQLISTSDIFSSDRFKAILAANLKGFRSYNLGRSAIPISHEINLNQISHPLKTETNWNDPECIQLEITEGLRVNLSDAESIKYGMGFEIWLRSKCKFVVVFRKQDEILGGVLINPHENENNLSGFRLLNRHAGTDNLVLYPTEPGCDGSVARISIVD